MSLGQIILSYPLPSLASLGRLSNIGIMGQSWDNGAKVFIVPVFRWIAGAQGHLEPGPSLLSLLLERTARVCDSPPF